jgi:hypothetical protein
MHIKTIIILVFFIPYHLFAMEPTAKDKKCFLLPTLSLQVFGLVAANYVTHLTTVYSVAATNKFYNQKMCVSAKKSAALLREYSANLAIAESCAEDGSLFKTCPIGAFAHASGTVRYEVFYRPNSELLIMRKCRLGGNNTIYQKKKKFPGFTWPLQLRPRPFFTKEGLLCFHGYGKVGKSGSDFSLVRDLAIGLPMGVIRYDFNGNALLCFLSYKNEKKQRERCSLIWLRGYPELLQAILNSKKVRLKKVYNAFFPKQKETIICYHLSGVTVPDNYPQEFTIDGYCGSEVALYNFDYTKAVSRAIGQKHKEQYGYTAE